MGGDSIEIDGKMIGVKVIEGVDGDGQFAVAVIESVNSRTDEEFIVSEAHIHRDRSMAYAAVRGLTNEYSFDMVSQGSTKAAHTIGRPVDVAKEALATAISHNIQNNYL